MKDELTFDQLVLIAGGHTAFQLLWAGIELGVFALLSKTPGLSSEQIGAGVDIQSQPLRILLVGLTSLKLILKEGDSYRNAGQVEKLLVPGNPEDMSAVLGWQRHIVYPGEIDFADALRNNTNTGLERFPGTEATLYERIAHDPALEKVFQEAMSSLSGSANAMLAAQVDLGNIRHLVDAGGGAATNAITLARANPDLRLTVFDSASICDRADANIAQAGLADRIDTHPGNFFIDNFPTGIDCILFAHLLTIWSPEQNITLLRRAYEALPDGGTVMIFNMMAWDSDDGPLVTALGSPYFLSIASGTGMMYAWCEYEDFLMAAGFSIGKRLELPKNHGVLIGTK